LVLLFPVVSASDDLLSASPETEESGYKIATNRSGGSTSKRHHGQPAFYQAPSALLPKVLDVEDTVFLRSIHDPQLLSLKIQTGRGPPISPVLLNATQKIQVFCS
jgi:hypothetical protein